MNAVLKDVINSAGIAVAAMERVSVARSKLVISQPFWGTLALYLKLEVTPSVETMSTNGVTLFFNADFVMHLTLDELIGVIAHEVSHCAYRHHTRRGKRELGLWNDAADYVVNPLLIGAGFTLPDGVLLDPKYNGLGAEEVYTILRKKRDEAKKQSAANAGQSGSPQPGQGSGNGQPQPGQAPGQPGTAPGQSPGQPSPSVSNGQGAGTPQPHPGTQGQSGSPAAPSPATGSQQGTSPGSGSGKEGKGTCPWGQVLDAAEAHEVPNIAANEAEWGVRVRQATAVARKKHAGHLPADIERVIEEVRKPAKIDWREHMRQFINDKVQYNYSWAKRNKRFTDCILPGHIVDDVDKIGIAIDTSGSIDNEALSAFATELKDIIDTNMVNEIVVVYCDADVQRVDRFSIGDDLKLNAKGGGGTRFSPALKWFEDNEPDVAAILYFTDLECSDFGNEPSQPLMWMGYGRESYITSKTVPFGEVVHLEP